jgi:hypothetical protein
MRVFIGSDRKINALASATVTPSCVTHLVGGFVLKSDLPIFKFSESDDGGILNVIT